jgi:hypothetical protein
LAASAARMRSSSLTLTYLLVNPYQMGGYRVGGSIMLPAPM